MINYSAAAFIICFITSVSSGMGTGGGGILTIYLSVFSGIEQIYAQGVNLLNFVFALSPPAAINMIRCKPDMRIITFLMFCGTAGCVLGVLMSSYAPDILLRKVCGIFLASAGAISLVKAAKREKDF